jgi:hypothetical protein
VVLTFGAFIASIASFALIPKQFFPTSTRPEILVDLWLPEGSSFEEVEPRHSPSGSLLIISRYFAAGVFRLLPIHEWPGLNDPCRDNVLGPASTARQSP